jgi:hypothetical protein
MSALLAAFLVAGIALIGAEIWARHVLQRRKDVRQDEKEAFFAGIWPAHVSYGDYRAALDYRYIRLFTLDPKRANFPGYRFDEHGFRLDAHNIGLTRKDGRKIIWMLGNSTLQGLGCREAETIPASLNDILAERGVSWRVANLGVGGMGSVQELLLVIELLHRGFSPDALIIYNGVIDQAKAHWVKDAPESWQEWQRKTPLAAQFRRLEQSADWTDADFLRQLVGDAKVLVRNRLALPTVLRGLKAPVLPSAPPVRPTAGGNWNAVVSRYLRNLNILKATADWLGIPVVFYFQPIMEYEEHYKIRRFAPGEVDLLRFSYTDEHVRRDLIYDPKHDALRKSLGDRFVDLYDVFRGYDDIQLYGDPRHPNARGNRLIAEAIASDLFKRKEFVEPA